MVAVDGEDGLWQAVEHDFDAVVLDVMLPKRTGYEVLRELRQAGRDVLVLMLTAKDGEWDQAEALDTGADDYLAKPFSYPVLLARLRALIRRSAGRADPMLNVGDLRVDTAAHRCWRGDTAVPSNREPVGKAMFSSQGHRQNWRLDAVAASLHSQPVTVVVATSLAQAERATGLIRAAVVIALPLLVALAAALTGSRSAGHCHRWRRCALRSQHLTTRHGALLDPGRPCGSACARRHVCCIDRGGLRCCAMSYRQCSGVAAPKQSSPRSSHCRSPSPWQSASPADPAPGKARTSCLKLPTTGCSRCSPG